MGLGAEEVPTYLAAAERHSAGLTRRDSLLIRGWKLADVDGDLEAIDLFEELVARFPDDLEAWHGLGDAIFHMGSQAGRPITAAIRPLERTLEIDSTFAPALIHLIELAYHQGDSARGREWTDRYLALDTTSMYAQSFRLLTPLEFGPSSDSTQAVAALDTADADLLHWLALRLRGSGANLPAYEMVTLALADPRFENPDRAMAFWHLGEAHLRHGHVAVAVDLFEQASALSDGELDGAVLYTLSDARELGIAVGPASDELVERLADNMKYPYPPLAVAAAREGRTEEADEAVAWLEGWADSATANGNTTRARSLDGRAIALRGRIAAVHDSVDTAIDHLRTGLSMINANWNRQRDIERYWLAHLIEDRGGEEEAMTIYGSLYWTTWAEPLGLFHRAELHERRGEFEQAGDYYAAFVQLWEDADPHLQPRVESARIALQRIRGEQVTS
jgi:tetratricopeptide (TPR) repeat protein